MYPDSAVVDVIRQCGLEGKNLTDIVTVCGENYSLGEKQLVCLARVLLKQPAILALDEATSALDQKTEVLFQKVLEEKFENTTILCIAHRLETLRWCRTRIEMGTGKLLSISDFKPEAAPNSSAMLSAGEH
jgi:ABC-type multidrug transport system fused ATPase/permease subunit